MSRSPLFDRQAITDLIYRYCRSVDRLDVPLGHSIWHEGATADYGASFHQGSGTAAINKICEAHRGLIAHSHQVTNILIALGEGPDNDKAGSESYCTATLRMQRGDALMQMSVWSRYVDRWSYRDGRWGLDHRIAIRDFDEIRTVTPMSQPEMGSRDESDPSYAALALPPA